MTSYGEALTTLAGGIAKLVAAGPDQEPLADPRSVLAARDSVVGAIRAAYLAVVTLPPHRYRASDLTLDPVPALGAALRGLTRAEPDLGAWDAAKLPEPEAAWGTATVAAVGVEAHLDGLARLSGEGAWTAVGDLARLAKALIHLDHDLARRHPNPQPAAVSALTDPVTHRRLWLCAEEVLHLAGSGRRVDEAAALRQVARRPLLVRRPADLPAGVARLADLLPGAGPLAVRDVVFCADALQRVAAAAAATLSSSDDPALGRLAAALGQLRGPLASLAGQRRALASITAPRLHLGAQSQALADICARGLDGANTNVQVHTGQQLARAAQGLADAVERTVLSGGYLVPSDEISGRRRGAGLYLWMPSHDPRQPRLAAALSCCQSIRQAGADLLVAADRAGASRTPSPQQRVTRELAAAITALDQVLAERPAASPTHPRPQHPRVAPTAGLRW